MPPKQTTHLNASNTALPVKPMRAKAMMHLGRGLVTLQVDPTLGLRSGAQVTTVDFSPMDKGLAVFWRAEDSCAVIYAQQPTPSRPLPVDARQQPSNLLVRPPQTLVSHLCLCKLSRSNTCQRSRFGEEVYGYCCTVAAAALFWWSSLTSLRRTGSK